MVSYSAVVIFAALAVAAAVEVQQCPDNGQIYLSNEVQLSPCKKSPCNLRKGTNQHITVQFTPNSDIDEVKNHVTAKVFGIDVPFIGVDGISICDKIVTTDDKNATCPLKAGTTYLYKDSFPILPFYPNLSLRVHWELQDKDGKGFVCFEVPAKISG